MNKEFIPYEQALALKELGFDEPCFGYYVDGELRGINLGMEELGGVEPYYQRFGFHMINNHDIDNSNKVVVTAPLYQQAFRWLREKYKLEGITQQAEDFAWYKWKISQYNEDGKKYVADWYEYETYEEAELACIIKLIEIVKQK